MDSLPDQILLRRKHIQRVWPDQTTQSAAEGSDWWTASKAQTEPRQKGNIHLIHRSKHTHAVFADQVTFLSSLMQISLLDTWWKMIGGRDEVPCDKLDLNISYHM